MSDDIFFDGVRYISASEAGDFAGLTRIYVARLCKEGKILARRVGRQWYVSQDSLEKFLVDLEYARAKRRGELVETRKQEYQSGEMKSAAIAPNKRETQKISPIENALRSALARMPEVAHARVANLSTSVPLHAVSLKGTLAFALPRSSKPMYWFTVYNKSHANACFARPDHNTLSGNCHRTGILLEQFQGR